MEDRARVALNIADRQGFAHAFTQVLADQNIPILLPNTGAGTLKKFESEYDTVMVHARPVLTRLEELDPESEIRFFTSGSTGEPKQIDKKLSHLLREIETIESFFSSRARGPIFSTVSHQHIYGLLFAVLWPLFSDREIGNMSIIFPEQLTLLDERYATYSLVASPSFLGRLDVTYRHPNCSLVTSSGSLLELDTAKKASQIFGDAPFEIFGSTETGGVARRQQSCANADGGWNLIEGVELDCDENSQFVVRSPFTLGEVTMGDRGRVLPDGRIHLEGRSDRIVKIEGKRVSLAEMENCLKLNPWVSEALALEEKTYRDHIALALVLTDKGQSELLSLGERDFKNLLRQELRLHFEAVTLPKKIRVLPAFPRNSESKVDMNLVREWLDA